jgi:long-chain acyl-CoA synthetase
MNIASTARIGSGEPERGTLLTGATGFLGGEVLARLLESGGPPVYALVRAGSEEQAQGRLDDVTESLLGGARRSPTRAIAVAGDIAKPALGMRSSRRTWLAARIGRIVHCAASVSFTLGLDESRAINVEGTRRLLDFAELCATRGRLDTFVHVSTAYVAGTHQGRFTEHDLDVGQGFRNPYERSKFEAELVVRERRSRLPVQIVRPSIVVGDSQSGWTPTFNVLYAPLRAFTRGAYPVVPARRSSPVDVVPVDYVADGIIALAGRPGTTYHLAAAERASSVGELLELASHYAGRPAPRVLPPVLYRRAIHPILVRSGRKARRRALRRSEVYFPYFSIRVRYDDALARAALRPLRVEVPRLPSYFERLIEFARAAEWGRRPLARHETMAGPASHDRGPAEPAANPGTAAFAEPVSASEW